MSENYQRSSTVNRISFQNLLTSFLHSLRSSQACKFLVYNIYDLPANSRVNSWVQEFRSERFAVYFYWFPKSNAMSFWVSGRELLFDLFADWLIDSCCDNLACLSALAQMTHRRRIRRTGSVIFWRSFPRTLDLPLMRPENEDRCIYW